MMKENEMKNLMVTNSILFLLVVLTVGVSTKLIQEEVRLDDVERERIFVSGFNAGWLNHADCVSWAVESEGAADLAEAYYWAEYFCPYEE
jgi:hypothetical protein